MLSLASQILLTDFFCAASLRKQSCIAIASPHFSRAPPCFVVNSSGDSWIDAYRSTWLTADLSHDRQASLLDFLEPVQGSSQRLTPPQNSQR